MLTRNSLRKLLVVFSIALSMCIIGSAEVFAADPPMSSQDNSVKISAADANESLISFFEEHGVSVTSSSIFELVTVSDTKLRSNSSGTALCMTSSDGNTVLKDILVVYKNDSMGRSVIDNSSSVLVSQNSQSTPADFPPKSWDGRYIVHARAYFDAYTPTIAQYYVRPQNVSFEYEKLVSNVSVSSISVRYDADGFEYSYPGFAKLGNDEVVHSITASKTNPAAGMLFMGFNAYPSNKVLSVSSGSPFVGQSITFDTVVDGESNGYTVKL